MRTLKAGSELMGSILQTTLGPKGALKIMQGPQSVTVTNDGATILKNLVIDNPASKILINASISQDWEEGDGTTSVVVLASLLIEEAYKLKIHPIKIIEGYQIGLQKAKEFLDKMSFEATDNDIFNLAKTTICSKILKCNIDLFAKMCIEAVDRAEGGDLGLINIIKLSGKLEESFLSRGFILKKNQDIERNIIDTECSDNKIVDESMDNKTENIRVLIANTSLDTDKIKVFGAKVSVNSISKLSEIEEAEKLKMRKKIDKICSVPFQVFINRQLIYDYPFEIFREKRVVAIEHAEFEGVERLVKFLGGKIMSDFDNLDEECLGICSDVRNITIGNEKMIKFDRIHKSASTIVLRGSSEEVLEESERSIHDALCVLSRVKKDNRLIYGGGATEMELAMCLNEYALKFPGKESESILAFSRALQRIPVILCENGGFDGEEVKARIRSEHFNGKPSIGVDLHAGEVGCMKKLGVVESLRIKKRVITAAIEVAQMIIKCDGFVKCRPRERSRE